jgi:hypothetical protein
MANATHRETDRRPTPCSAIALDLSREELGDPQRREVSCADTFFETREAACGPLESGVIASWASPRRSLDVTSPTRHKPVSERPYRQWSGAIATRFALFLDHTAPDAPMRVGRATQIVRVEPRDARLGVVAALDFAMVRIIAA